MLVWVDFSLNGLETSARGRCLQKLVLMGGRGQPESYPFAFRSWRSTGPGGVADCS